MAPGGAENTGCNSDRGQRCLMVKFLHFLAVNGMKRCTSLWRQSRLLAVTHARRGNTGKEGTRSRNVHDAAGRRCQELNPLFHVGKGRLRSVTVKTNLQIRDCRLRLFHSGLSLSDDEHNLATGRHGKRMDVAVEIYGLRRALHHLCPYDKVRLNGVICELSVRRASPRSCMRPRASHGALSFVEAKGA